MSCRLHGYRWPSVDTLPIVHPLWQVFRATSVPSHSCWMYVRAGRPAFARPYVGSIGTKVVDSPKTPMWEGNKIKKLFKGFFSIIIQLPWREITLTWTSFISYVFSYQNQTFDFKDWHLLFNPLSNCQRFVKRYNQSSNREAIRTFHFILSVSF